MSKLLPILFALLLPTLASAASINGRFMATLEGTPTVLTVGTRGGVVTGLYEEPGFTLQAKGRFEGDTLHLTLSDGARGLTVAHLEGQLQGERLKATVNVDTPATGLSKTVTAVFVREAPVTASERDAQLVGLWTHENMINSSGPNFASFTTVLTMEIGAGGQLRQWTQSVAGGKDWSYGGDAGRKLVFEGQWSAKDGVLYGKARGQGEFQALTRYRRAGKYLVTEDASGKRNWQPR